MHTRHPPVAPNPAITSTALAEGPAHLAATTVPAKNMAEFLEKRSPNPDDYSILVGTLLPLATQKTAAPRGTDPVDSSHFFLMRKGRDRLARILLNRGSIKMDNPKEGVIMVFLRFNCMMIAGILSFATMARAQQHQMRPESLATLLDYNENKITITTDRSYDSETGWSDWTTIQEGTNRILDGADFYIRVGHPELAAEYENRQAWKGGLLWGGLAGTLAGGLIAAETHDSNDREYKILFWAGTGIALAGLACLGIGSEINPHPVPMREVRKLADEYNRSLRKDLKFTLAPWIGPGGGGLALSLRM